MFGARVISEAGGVRVRICGCETVGAGDGEREREMGVGGYSTQNGKNAPWAE